jgi:endonuclease/exonuclease/phosphatase family metal-dependent hydrolase
MSDATMRSAGIICSRRNRRCAPSARPPVSALGLGFLLLLVVDCAAAAIGEESKTLRVATLNLAHGRGLAYDQLGIAKEKFEENVAAIGRLLREKESDVVALQEADAPSAWSGLFDHVARIKESAGYDHDFHGLHFRMGIGELKVQYGTALLSRTPLAKAESHKLVDATWHTKGFVVAETDFDGRSILLVSLHLNSDSAETRRRQAKQIVGALSPKLMPMVMMGDFNSRWENANDAVHLIAKGLALEAFKPDSKDQWTFRADRLTQRIDWILISPQLEFVEYKVWEERVSDHLGVEATVKWKAE